MSEIKTYKYYAGNKWHEPSSGQYFESEDPSIGKVWAKLPDCNVEDINIAVKSAKRLIMKDLGEKYIQLKEEEF